MKRDTNPQTIQIKQQRRDAAFVPSSFNDDDNTIEVVFASEYPVRKYSWSEDGYINEILEISKAAVDMTRLNNGASVLNSHHQYSLEGVIGVVEKAWLDITAKEARAIVRLSKREEVKGIVGDIKAGIIRNVSVGYRVHEYIIDRKADTWTAKKWEASEISFTAVQADPTSGSRSEGDTYTATILNSNLMSETQDETRAAEVITPAAAPAVSAETRAAETEPAKPGLTPDQIRTQAVEDERTRVSTITDSCQRAGLPAEFGTTLISSGTAIGEARAAIIDEIAKRSNKAPVTQNVAVTGEDEADKIRTSIIDGISFRAVPGSVDISGNERSRKYANMRLLDIAKDRLRAKGEKYDMLSEQEIVRRAWSTTDYPSLLTATFDRTLRRFYEGSVDEWRWAARQESATDFREKAGITVDGAVTFEQIPEGGVYKETPILMSETQKIKLRKYGRKYSITDIAIINDDLGVFNRLPQILAIGAQQFQSEAVWALITANAKAPDGKALFHVDHKNLATAPGAVISEDTLSAARTAMRRQLSMAGHKLGVKPKYLLVPPELETAADKMVTAIVAGTTGDVNVFANRLEVRVSDMLTNAKAWYLVADPAATMVDGLVYAYLNGQAGLRTESRVNWETDALEVKGHMAFAAGVWGYQGWYKNPGGA